MKIRHKILLAALGGFLLAAGALLLFIRATLPGDLAQLVVAEREEEARRVVHQIEQALAQRKALLERLAAQLHDGDRLLPPEQLNRRLQGQVLGEFFFNGGLALFGSDAIGIAEAPQGSGRLGLDIADRDHVLQVRRSHETVVTRPLVSRSLGRPSFFINAPVRSDDGALLGFLVGVTVLQSDNFLIEVGLAEQRDGSLFYVFDEANGLIVTASDPALAMEPLPVAGEVPLFDAVHGGERAGLVAHRDGTRYIYGSATVPSMGWSVVKALPEALATAPVRQLTARLLYLSLLALTLGGLLLGVLLDRLLAPLRHAAQQIDAMVDGRQRAAPLPLAGHDEVGQLVQSFNRLFASLEEQSQRLRLATVGSGIGIWDYDVSSGGLTWDDNMYALYGIGEGDFGGAYAAWEAGLHPDDLDAARRSLQAALAGEGGFDTEFRVVHPSGEVRWIKANAIVLRDAAGSAVRMIGVNWDITERKRVELLKNQFISTVSHELRTPLTSIRGTLGLACGGAVGELSPKLAQLLEVAKRNSEYLSALVDDLLDIEKLTSGEIHFELRPQPILPLLQEVVEANRGYASQYGVELVLSGADGGLQAAVDSQRLRQVVSNLLSNAVKFSTDGDRVELALETSEERLTVSVRDHGPGVPPEFRQRIFQRFSQADASDARARGGTGLGLAISREIVERMGGEIGYYSVPGEGASFYFSLPLASAADTCPESPPRDAP